MSNYIPNNLYINEEVLITPKLHWIVYLNTYILLSLVGIYFMYPFIDYGSNVLVFEYAEKIIGLVLVIRLIYVLFRDYSVEMAVTNQRVFRKNGIIKVRLRGFYNYNIRAVKVRQSIMGKILNYGTVIFFGKEKSRLVFKKVYAPWYIKAQVEAIVSQCIENRQNTKQKSEQ